jgi:hypothetical protein
MASTASWTAALVAAFIEVELEVPDSPKSSAIDSLFGFKLDRSELIELVLIPLLLYAVAARG